MLMLLVQGPWVLKFVGYLDSLESYKEFLMSRPQPIPIQSEYLGVRPGSLFLLNYPR